MNIAKYSIFIEYLRFGLKHKEEGLRWTKMTYLSLALAAPRGRFGAGRVQQYHKGYVVKYSRAKARRESRRKRQGRFFSKFGGWKINRGRGKGRSRKRISLVSTLRKYRPAVPQTTSSDLETPRARRKRTALRQVLKRTILKTVASKVKVTFRPSGERKFALKSNWRSQIRPVKLTLPSSFYGVAQGAASLVNQLATPKFNNFNVPQLRTSTKNHCSIPNYSGTLVEGQTKYRQADYRIAKRARSVRKSAYGRYLQLLESRKKFSSRELDTLQSINPREILVGAKFLFFFYGGLYPGAFRKLRRSFTSKNVLKIKHIVWFWQKLALMVSFYVNKIMRNSFVWKMSQYGHKSLRSN